MLKSVIKVHTWGKKKKRGRKQLGVVGGAGSIKKDFPGEAPAKSWSHHRDKGGGVTNIYCVKLNIGTYGETRN